MAKAKGAPKSGGRAKGTPNKDTLRRRAMLVKAAEEAGITPLEVMLKTMRDYWEQGAFGFACEVAKDAAPYVHPKLAAFDAKVSGNLIVELTQFDPDSDTE